MAVQSTLKGYEKDDVNIQNAVYRVKNSSNDEYKRIHFETSSKMIYDATDQKIGNMVARRNKDGDIQFRNIYANGGTVVADGKITGKATLEILGNSDLKGAATIGVSVANDTTALTVSSNKNTSLGGKLTVSGLSTFNSKTTHEAEATVKGTLSVEAKSGGAAGNLSVSGNSTLTGTLGVGGATSINNTLNVVNSTTLRSTLTVADNTSLNKNLTVAGTGTINGVLTVNNNSTLGKADNTNTTTINGVAAVNKLTIKNSEVVANLNADRVDSCHVNDSLTDTSSLWTAKKIDDTKANKSTQILAGESITITGGNLGVNTTVAHSNVARNPQTTKELNTTGTSCNVLSAVSSNSQGHVSGSEIVNLDERYANKATTISAGNGLSGGGAISGNQTISHKELERGADVALELDPNAATCSVVRSVKSNEHGHVTLVNTVNLDERYPTRSQVTQEIADKVTGQIKESVLLKGENVGSANGPVLTMSGFSIKYNKGAVEFIIS